jgi:hypothetical protein
MLIARKDPHMISRGELKWLGSATAIVGIVVGLLESTIRTPGDLVTPYTALLAVIAPCMLYQSRVKRVWCLAVMWVTLCLLILENEWGQQFHQ